MIFVLFPGDEGFASKLARIVEASSGHSDAAALKHDDLCFSCTDIAALYLPDSDCKSNDVGLHSPRAATNPAHTAHTARTAHTAHTAHRSTTSAHDPSPGLRVRPFMENRFARAHRATDFNRLQQLWRNPVAARNMCLPADVPIISSPTVVNQTSNPSSIISQTGLRRCYPVAFQGSAFEEGFEPYVLISRAWVCRYDEGLRGYGRNKALHLYHLHRMGLCFWVCPDVCLLHLPHEASQDRVKLLGRPTEVFKTATPSHPPYCSFAVTDGAGSSSKPTIEAVIDSKVDGNRSFYLDEQSAVGVPDASGADPSRVPGLLRAVKARYSESRDRITASCASWALTPHTAVDGPIVDRLISAVHNIYSQEMPDQTQQQPQQRLQRGHKDEEEDGEDGISIARVESVARGACSSVSGHSDAQSEQSWDAAVADKDSESILRCCWLRPSSTSRFKGSDGHILNGAGFALHSERKAAGDAPLQQMVGVGTACCWWPEDIRKGGCSQLGLSQYLQLGGGSSGGCGDDWLGLDTNVLFPHPLPPPHCSSSLSSLPHEASNPVQKPRAPWQLRRRHRGQQGPTSFRNLSKPILTNTCSLHMIYTEPQLILTR